MTFPTSAEIKAKLGGLVRAHWPIIIILIFTYCGGVERRDYMGRVVQAIGAAGIVVVLPIFKLQKNIWLYISSFILCIMGASKMVDVQYIANAIGLGWLSSWSIVIIKIAVQGAIISFICLLILYILIFRLQGSAALLVKVPICMLFLLAALTPTFLLLWVLIALSGLFGPV